MSDLTYVWADALNTAVLAIDGGQVVATIPAENGSRRYEALLRDQVTIEPYTAPDISLDDQKMARSNDVNAYRESLIAAGYHHNFGGTIGTRILDQRGPEDVTSWLALKLMAQDLNSAEQGDTLIPIRDANNATFSAKSTAVEAAMSAMGQWRATILQHSWELKDRIGAAADSAALEAIDINVGWPE